MSIILRMAGGDLARPVVSEAHAFELRPHGFDVLAGPDRRMGLLGDRRIFGRQPESVPSHRMEDVVASRATVAGNHIAHCVVTDMSDMECAGRVGKHFEDIIFRPPGLGGDLEEPPLAPAAQPFRFAFPETVACHDCSRPSSGLPAHEPGAGTRWRIICCLSRSPSTRV